MPFMRYVVARYNKEQRDMAYRIVVSDTLRMISEDIATDFGGKYMKFRYADIIKPKEPEDTRTAEDVIRHISEGLRRL